MVVRVEPDDLPDCVRPIMITVHPDLAGPAVSIARGYPATTVDGFDLDEPAIARARSIAQDAGVADRVAFHTRDAADPSLSGQYDLAVIVDALHDMSRPVDVLASVREDPAPGRPGAFALTGHSR